jgi:hypothetical protein
MDGKSGLPNVGFDGRAFWHEANAVLAKGTREMLINARDKDGLVAAYDRMDEALGALVERMGPPEKVREDLNFKLNDRICLVGRMMKAGNIDVETYWGADMKKVAMLVLKALGRTRSQVFRIDRLIEDATDALCEGNFTKDGARRLLAELSAYDCKDLKSLFSKLDDGPSHMGFMKLVSESGTAKARKAAKAAIESLAPSATIRPLAKVMPVRMLAQVRQPLRHA